MMRIAAGVFLDERDVSYTFVLAGGPGGQHVNKTATAVQLRFNPAGHTPLPEPVVRRLRRLAGAKMNAAGEVVLTARRYRSQDRNRRDADERLVALIEAATRRRRSRRTTRPTAASRERRLRGKRQRAATKRLRGSVAPDRE